MQHIAIVVLTITIAGCAPAPERTPAPADPASPGDTPPPGQSTAETAAEPQSTEPDQPEAQTARESQAPELSKPEPQPEPQPEPELKPEPKPEPRQEPKPQPHSQPQPEAQKRPEAATAESDAGQETLRDQPATMDIAGRISLDDDEAKPSQAVIYFVPDDAQYQTPATPPSEPFDMTTEDKQLSPTVGVVPRGTTLRFPNRDPILHNLFSVSGDNRFDVGLYGPGEAPTTTVNAPGVVDIFCNVHHEIHAHILVLESPYYTRADASGHFELTGLPRTGGQLEVWHRQTEGWSTAIAPPADNAFSIPLKVTRPALPPHRDKRGESYMRRDRDPYR